MLMDLLGDLAIIAVYDHTILIIKADICSTYMIIHNRRLCSVIIDNRFIKYSNISIHWDMIVISDILKFW